MATLGKLLGRRFKVADPCDQGRIKVRHVLPGEGEERVCVVDFLGGSVTEESLTGCRWEGGAPEFLDSFSTGGFDPFVVGLW